jgi:hypothetical protein
MSLSRPRRDRSSGPPGPRHAVVAAVETLASSPAAVAGLGAPPLSAWWDEPAPRVVVPQRSTWLAWTAVVALALALRLACSTGLAGSDDLFYAKYANAIVAGQYTQTYNAARGVEPRHWALRYGLLLPLAGVYRVAGVSEWSTVALPLVASTVCVLLLMQIGRRLFDARVALLAGLIYATFPMQLRYATVLEPEPLAQCFALLGVICYLQSGPSARGAWPVAAGMQFGAAYLAKETAVFVAGAFLLHALFERRWQRAALLAIGVSSVVAAEHAYYLFVQGDILFRPHSTQLFNLRDPENLRNLNDRWVYRLFVQYPRSMLVPSRTFGLHSLVCLCGAAAALLLKPRRHYLLLLLWAVIPWLYMNFGSWSLERYAIMPRADRYLDLVYPPLMLLTALVISRALAVRGRVATLTVAALAVVLVVGVASGLATRGRISQSAQMAVLREMLHESRGARPATFYTDNTKWRMALAVFDASRLSTSPDAATFVLGSDPLGLPAIQSRATPPDDGTRSGIDERVP